MLTTEVYAGPGRSNNRTTATFPADEETLTARAVAQLANDRLRYSGDWPGLGWQHATDAWVERTWPQVAEVVVRALAKVSYYNAQAQKIPVVSPAGLRVVNAAAAGTAGVDVIPPTESGWSAFLAQAPGSGLKFGEIAEAGSGGGDASSPATCSRARPTTKTSGHARGRCRSAAGRRRR